MNKIHIVYYLNNQATLEEKQELLEWLRSDEKNRMFFHEMCVIWQASTAVGLTEEEISKAFDKFQIKLDNPRI